MYAIEEGLGPLPGAPPAVAVISFAQADGGEDEEAESYWEEIHGISSILMLFLVLLHIGGVIISSRLHNEHLVRVMVTGKKSSQTGAG